MNLQEFNRMAEDADPSVREVIDQANQRDYPNGPRRVVRGFGPPINHKSDDSEPNPDGWANRSLGRPTQVVVAGANMTLEKRRELAAKGIQVIGSM
jgi:hypothetical protein